MPRPPKTSNFFTSLTAHTMNPPPQRTRQRERERPAASGTQTITLTGTPAPEIRIPDGTLILRGASNTNRRVTWGEDVVDNEGLGRKKSKICCIFKKQREFGESSSESDSSDDDSGSDSDEGGKPHEHRNGNGNGNGDCDHGHKHGQSKRRQKRGSPNAYDRMPKNRKDKDKKDGKDSTSEPTNDPAPADDTSKATPTN